MMMTDLERLANAAERYMDAVKAVFAIDPNTKKCFAEGSPTKDQETYERFVCLNNCGKALSEALAATTQKGSDNA
jgi:hypothetical protein